MRASVSTYVDGSEKAWSLCVEMEEEEEEEGGYICDIVIWSEKAQVLSSSCADCL